MAVDLFCEERFVDIEFSMADGRDGVCDRQQCCSYLPVECARRSPVIDETALEEKLQVVRRCVPEGTVKIEGHTIRLFASDMMSMCLHAYKVHFMCRQLGILENIKFF